MVNDVTFPIAIVTASLMLVLGCSMLFTTRSWLALLTEFSEQPHRLLIPGIATVVFGLIVIFNHNFWEKSWEVAITLAGWLILMKGLTFLLIPDVVNLHAKFPEPVVKMVMRIGGAVIILVALKVLLIITGQA